VNLSFYWNDSVQPGVVDPVVVTTQKLLELCGRMDVQALWAGWAGLVLSIALLFWHGRIKERVRDEYTRRFIDKFLHTLIAMCFVIIIVRLLRAG
jgi:hypothetical protein